MPQTSAESGKSQPTKAANPWKSPWVVDIFCCVFRWGNYWLQVRLGFLEKRRLFLHQIFRYSFWVPSLFRLRRGGMCNLNMLRFMRDLPHNPHVTYTNLEIEKERVKIKRLAHKRKHLHEVSFVITTGFVCSLSLFIIQKTQKGNTTRHGHRGGDNCITRQTPFASQKEARQMEWLTINNRHECDNAWLVMRATRKMLIEMLWDFRKW